MRQVRSATVRTRQIQEGLSRLKNIDQFMPLSVQTASSKQAALFAWDDSVDLVAHEAAGSVHIGMGRCARRTVKNDPGAPMLEARSTSLSSGMMPSNGNERISRTSVMLNIYPRAARLASKRVIRTCLAM